MLTSNRIKNLHPYVPGEQPKDRDYIKLNANENPYPPAPSVQKAVLDFVQNHPEKMGLYPDPDSNELHAAIADMLNKTGGVLCRATGDDDLQPAAQDKIPFTVTPDMIYTGNGSDEVLSLYSMPFLIQLQSL